MKPYQGGNSYQQPYQGDNNYQQQPYQGKTYYQQPTYVSNQLPPTTTSDEDPTNIIYLLGTTILSIGIFTLLTANIGVVSSCLLIGLGAEMIQDDSNLVKQGCSLRGTAIAAIVMASLEFIPSLIMFSFAISFYGYQYRSLTSCYSCVPESDTFSIYFSYNFGSSVLGTVTKLSLCSLYLHLTKNAKHMDIEEYPSLRQKTLSPRRVYYGFGAITLTIGIITLLSSHLGFISSCIIIALGAEWMKARNEESFLFQRGIHSMKSTAMVGIILASIELLSSIGFVSYMYVTDVTPSPLCIRSPYYPYDYNGSCQLSDLSANFSVRVYAMYNFGAVLIGFVIKVLLFWMSLRLTSAHYDNSDENQVVVKEETSLLGSNTTQLRVGTFLAEVLQSKLREHENRKK